MPRLFALIPLALSSWGQPVELKPFPSLEGKKVVTTRIDLSFLLEAPAGGNGFIGIRNGHLATPDGRRFRIWGTNVVAAACTPSHEGAAILAGQFARFGLNCVRFHFLDRPAPNGIIDARRGDTRAFDADALDRFDYFVAQLKRRGIYINLNLNVGRTYKAGDGVRDFELLGFAKALTYFDGRLLELQREYARQLLMHYNPYTRSQYRNEPAVLIIEMVNENSIVEAWVNNRLLGRATRKNPGTWTDIPASYERVLTEKYGAPRLTPHEFASAPAERFHKEAAFYMGLEDSYFQSMRRLIRDELGSRSLLVGTRANTVYPLLRSAARLDVVDGHTYWQHPRYLEDPAGKRHGFEIGNTPMVNEPLRSSVIQLSKAAVAGKPYTVSEVNHPFPNEYACEGIPVLGAYAALQDWDGIFWFSYGNSDPANWQAYQSGHFLLRPDPVKMAEIAAGAAMFLRADVQPARSTVARSYSATQVIESLRLPRSEQPWFTPGFPLSLPLRHAVRISSLDGEPTGRFEDAASDPIVADTGELTWRKSPRGVVTVNTPRSQALVGFVGEANGTKNLAVQVRNRFCAVMLTALDTRPLTRSARMLLAAGARVANTGMEWNERRTSLVKWGGQPTLIEPVTGIVTLRALDGARAVLALPLDSAGQPLGAPLRARKMAAGWEIVVGEPATTWYEVSVKR